MGDYGIIGCAFLAFSKGECEIKNIVMSCRVFERQIEFSLMEVITHVARNMNCQRLTAKFVQNVKNKKFENYYAQCGLKKEAEGLYGGKLEGIKVTELHPFVEIEEIK